MGRRAVVVFALLASLLAVTAMPVGAVQTNTAVGSIHTNDTDFNAATELTNVSVEGTGTAADVALSGEEPLPTSAIHEWRMAAGSGSTITDDIASNDGTIDGAGWVSDTWTDGQALDFVSGNSDHVDFDSTESEIDVNGDFSIAVTIEPDSVTDGHVLTHTISNSNRGAIAIDSGTLSVGWYDGSSYQGVQSTSISANERIRIFYTYNSGTGTLYVNKTEKTGTSTPSVTTQGGFRLSNLQDSSYFDGTIDNLVVYDSAVSSSEVGEDFARQPWTSESSAPATGTYISSTHSVTNPTTGWTNLTLSNVAATVTWTADTDGDSTFETQVAQNTYTTTANHTVSLSGTDAEAWRVNVTYERTGSNPTGELHDEGLLFTNHEPRVKNATASPAGGSATNAENVQLSIDVNDSEFGTAQGDSLTAEWFVNGTSIGTTNLNSNGTASITANGLTDGTHTWRVEVTDDYGLTNVSSTFAFEVEHHAPDLDNTSASPQGGAQLTQNQVTLEIPVNDTDFAETSGDSVDVEFSVDGASEGTVTLTSNGTASLSVTIVEGGSHEWTATATDEYGNTTTSQTFTFQSPGNVTIREETNPDQLVNTATVNITAYYGDEVDTRTVTDGQLNLTGFPVDQPIVLRANASGYVTRTAVIESVFEQSNMFLLNESVSHHTVRFNLEDPTGNYPREDTVLFVERDLNLSGATEWRTITGDEFGVQGVPVDLVADERYRLRIKNLDTGTTVVLGAYTAIQSETVTVSAGSASISLPDSEKAYGWETEKNDTGQYILVQYNDTAGITESVKITIRERYNTSNVLVDNQTFTGTSNLVFQTPLTNEEVNQTWEAVLYIDRGDGYMRFTVPITGGPTSLVPPELDAVWVSAIGVFVLLITAMAFSQLNQGVGAITTSIVGGFLWWFGVLTGPAVGAAFVAALSISVVFHYQHGGGA